MVEVDEEAVDGERDVDEVAFELLYPNKGDGGDEPAVKGRTNLEAGTVNLFRPSPPSPFPFMPFERVNNESLRCLEYSRSLLALDALLATSATLAGESPPITDVSNVTYSLVPVKSPSPVTIDRSGTVPSSGPTKKFEPLGWGCR
jgi:hypothetical protein